MKKLEDRYIDELFSPAPDYGASLLCANFPRSYIDVNRARDDIDPHLLSDIWPEEKFGPINPTSRSDSGIGLIPRLVKPGVPIYANKLSSQEIMNRIMTCYDPYHEALKNLYEEAHYLFGQVLHINCHSMPRSSAYPKTYITMIGGKQIPSDIVLGDRDGQTCGRELIGLIRDFWQSLGYRVTINDPFKGVELVRRHAQPTRGKHSLQMEINRGLFMNEDTGERTSDFNKMQDHVQRMMDLLKAYSQEKIMRTAAD